MVTIELLGITFKHLTLLYFSGVHYLELLCDPCQISSQNLEITHLDRTGYIEGRWGHAKPWPPQQSENMWKTKILLAEQTISLAPCPFVHAQLNNVFNKYLPSSNTEKEFDVPSVHGKLLKYIVHSSKWKYWKINILLHKSGPNSNQQVLDL